MRICNNTNNTRKMKKQCTICKKEYETKFHNKKLCSKECRLIHRSKTRDRSKDKEYYYRPEIRLKRELYYKANKEKIKEQHSDYYQNNKEKIGKLVKKYRENNKEKVIEWKKIYRKDNKENILSKERIYRENNRKEIRAYDKILYQNNKENIGRRVKKYRETHKEIIKEWRNNNKEKRNNKRRIEWKNNPSFRLNTSMSVGIYHSLKGNKNECHWEYLVNYTLEDLKSYLEKQFDKNMTWDNYGAYWHLDHRIPISWFNIKEVGDDQFNQCWALYNLKPMEAKANMNKSNRYSEPTILHFTETTT